jgi:hypothetical protein
MVFNIVARNHDDHVKNIASLKRGRAAAHRAGPAEGLTARQAPGAAASSAL